MMAVIVVPHGNPDAVEGCAAVSKSQDVSVYLGEKHVSVVAYSRANKGVLKVFAFNVQTVGVGEGDAQTVFDLLKALGNGTRIFNVDTEFTV
jgi:hypothetical protein